MAKIRNIEQQKDALSQIAKLVADVKTMNEFMEANDEELNYKLSLGKNKVRINSSKRDQINALIKEYKEEVALEILSLANDNHIDLDDDDKAILGIN